MNKQIQECTSTLTDYLSELTVSEFDLLYRYCRNKIFTCDSINLHLECIDEIKGDWMVEFTDSMFGIELYRYKVEDLSIEDQLELIKVIKVIEEII